MEPRTPIPNRRDILTAGLGCACFAILYAQDVSGVLEQMIDANRANRAKGPAGNHGSRLQAELAKRGQNLPLLGDDDVTADRNYIREFILARRRVLGKALGVPYAEAFHHIGGAARPSAAEEYVKKNEVPIKYSGAKTGGL